MIRYSKINNNLEREKQEKTLKNGDVVVVKNTNCSNHEGDVLFRIVQIGCGTLIPVVMDEANRTGKAEYGTINRGAPLKEIEKYIKYLNHEGYEHYRGDEIKIDVSMKK